MKEYFEEQLKDSKTITKELLPKLKGKFIYNKYQIGDKILVFLEQEIGDIDIPESPIYTQPTIIFNMRMITERELDKLNEDFIFIRMFKKMPSSIPILERNKK